MRLLLERSLHYHWPTEREFRDAVEAHISNDEAFRANHTPPDSKGGYGYPRFRDPYCPECNGPGEPFSTLVDTSKLSPEARAIFGGLTETVYGTGFTLPDRIKALGLIGKILGMLEKDLEIPGKNGRPIQHEVKARVVIVPAKQNAQIRVTNLELRPANEILSSASACFAMAEFDCQSKQR